LQDSSIERVVASLGSCTAGKAALGTDLNANWLKLIGYHRTWQRLGKTGILRVSMLLR
jgi:hypothetical protein